MPDTANRPGARQNAAGWMDNAGRLWLFGGVGGSSNGYFFPAYNDLWSYDTATHQWTWVSGDNTPGQPGVYGKKGIADVANKPGAREGAVSWTDNANNVWIFGGLSQTAFNTNGRYLNDLWKYNPSTNVWTWMSGDNSANNKGVYGTVGVPDAANKPGSRFDGVGWTDASGKLWLFGGRQISFTPYFLFNDLWNYDPATNLWTWVSGDSTINNYGKAGSRGTASASNKPGARSNNIAWKDKSGNLWLMGGSGYGVKNDAYLNDVWKFTLPSLILPVKFISFTAVAHNNTVALNWQTAEEQNCAYYTVERSHNGMNFDSIGTVTALNKAHIVSSYAITDHDPFGDVGYYRITEVDLDGKRTYTSVRKVMMNTAGFSCTIAQNPVTDELKFNLQSNQSLQLQLEVRDIAGRPLIITKQKMIPGRVTNTIPVRHLAPGNYVLTVNTGKTSVTKRFIKQ